MTISKEINCAENEYMNICPPNYRSSGAPALIDGHSWQIQSFLTFQTILFFLTYSRLSWYINYRKKLAEKNLFVIYDHWCDVLSQWWTRLLVSDAVKFNMADRVHRLSLAAGQKEVGRHFECSVRGCVPLNTCRACAPKILKKWVQKIARVTPLYSLCSMVKVFMLQKCVWKLGENMKKYTNRYIA